MLRGLRERGHPQCRIASIAHRQTTVTRRRSLENMCARKTGAHARGFFSALIRRRRISPLVIPLEPHVAANNELFPAPFFHECTHSRIRKTKRSRGFSSVQAGDTFFTSSFMQFSALCSAAASSRSRSRSGETGTERASDLVTAGPRTCHTQHRAAARLITPFCVIPHHRCVDDTKQTRPRRGSIRRFAVALTFRCADASWISQRDEILVFHTVSTIPSVAKRRPSTSLG